MKKLLSLLATVSLVSTSTASIVACGNGNNDPIDEDIKQDISTIISVTDLGDIHFHSLAGNDVQTRTEIINKIRTLNPNVSDAQINISNINRENGTASVSVLGLNGSLTVTFTPPHAIEPEPISISIPSSPNSILQLQDGTILVAGGTAANGSNSFLVSVDLSDPDNPQTQILAQGSTAFPAVPWSMTQLQDSIVLVAGGTAAANSFLASVDLSDPDNPQTQILAQGSTAFPSIPRSMLRLQDGTILVTGGIAFTGENSFLASVDLSDPDNPQIQILAQGPDDAFPAAANSIIQLQDGTLLITGGTAANGSDSFLASVDLSDPDNPQIQILAQGSLNAFPSAPREIIQLQDGTFLIAGGNADNGSNSFLASVDLFDPANPQIQILAQGSTAFPSALWSIVELYDGTILVAGGNAANGSDSFLRMI